MAGLLAIAEPALIGVGVIALPIGGNALIQYLRLRKVLPVIRRAFTVLDPLLNEHIRGYSGSQVRFAMELVTGVLADGTLTRDEIEEAVREIEKRYAPSRAAGKTGDTLKLQLGVDSTEAKLFDAVIGVVDKRELLPKNLIDAAKVIRLKIS